MKCIKASYNEMVMANPRGDCNEFAAIAYETFWISVRSVLQPSGFTLNISGAAKERLQVPSWTLPAKDLSRSHATLKSLFGVPHLDFGLYLDLYRLLKKAASAAQENDDVDLVICAVRALTRIFYGFPVGSDYCEPHTILLDRIGYVPDEECSEECDDLFEFDWYGDCDLSVLRGEAFVRRQLGVFHNRELYEARFGTSEVAGVDMYHRVDQAFGPIKEWHVMPWSVAAIIELLSEAVQIFLKWQGKMGALRYKYNIPILNADRTSLVEGHCGKPVVWDTGGWAHPDTAAEVEEGRA